MTFVFHVNAIHSRWSPHSALCWLCPPSPTHDCERRMQQSSKLLTIHERKSSAVATATLQIYARLNFILCFAPPPLFLSFECWVHVFHGGMDEGIVWRHGNKKMMIQNEWMTVEAVFVRKTERENVSKLDLICGLCLFVSGGWEWHSVLFADEIGLSDSWLSLHRNQLVSFDYASKLLDCMQATVNLHKLAKHNDGMINRPYFAILTDRASSTQFPKDACAQIASFFVKWHRFQFC